MQGAGWIGCERMGACATTPPRRSTRDYIYQNPWRHSMGDRVQVESAQWHDYDIAADRTSTVALQGKRQSGGLIQALIVAAFFERERDIDYAQAMKKCRAANSYPLRPAMTPPTDSFSDTPEQLAAKRAEWDKRDPARCSVVDRGSGHASEAVTYPSQTRCPLCQYE